MPTAPDFTRHHPTAPTRSSPVKKTESTPERHKGPCQKMLTKTSLSALCACGPVADNEVQQGSNRAKLTCQGRGAEFWCLGWNIHFGRAFTSFFLCRSKSFLRSLKGRSRTEDLGFKEILRRIYFKVCMLGSIPQLLVCCCLGQTLVQA